MKLLQEEVQKLQKSISETVSSENLEVTVVMNGNIQITSLSIRPDVEIPEITPLLIETINRGIKKTSESLKHNIVILQQKIQLQ